MNNITNISADNTTDDCTGLGESWWRFIATEAVLYLLLFLTFLALFMIHWLLAVKLKVPACMKLSDNKVYSSFRKSVRQLISGDTIFGKILLTVTLLCNLIYIGLAIHRSILPHMVEECVDVGHPEVIVELVIVVELLVFTLVRFLACSNVALFWLQPHTIVDVLTLSHIFISLYFGVDWIGFRSLRFIWLTQIITVVQFTPLVCSQNTVSLIRLLVYFLILWLTSSGLLHLIESRGDFWKEVNNVEHHTVLIYVYLTMVTMSTVGYGDISPVTDLGRGFMILFIIGGLAFFAAILPTLVEVVIDFYAKYQYARFDTTRVPRHVIVCGHVTATTAAEFLKDFLHRDRGDTLTNVLFLHPERPEKDLKNVLRSYYTRVQFLLGSVLNGNDLKKAKILDSTAIFILANKHTYNPTEEDHANLLRVVSVKNTTNTIPVIIQFLHSFSKVQASKIEGWSYGRDTAVCLNELKLGLLAQSCLCPGFSTLVANLFYTSDFPIFTSFTGDDEWKEHYIKGASNEVYSSTFSEFFDGMTFHEAAAVCFNKLNLVMLALEQIERNCHCYYVNPSLKRHPKVRINSEAMLGYFIAQDKEHVLDVSFYCECCPNSRHLASSRRQSELRRKLSKMRRSSSLRQRQLVESPRSSIADNNDLIVHFTSSSTNIPFSLMKNRAMELIQGSDQDQLLSVDLDSDSIQEEDDSDDKEKWKLYTSDPVRLEQSILNPDVFSLANYNFMPSADIKDHIILCLFADGNSPLLGLHNFLKPLRSKHLPQESIKPVVIICEKAFIEKEWSVICDIPKVYLVVGSPLLGSNLTAAKVSKCSVCVILTMLHTSSGHEQAIDDKESILCSISIQKKLQKMNKNVPVITDLRQESNVQFLDFEDEDAPDERIYKAKPFACGKAFSVSMFDSVTSSVFHDPGTLYLVEEILDSVGTKNACRVVSKPICETGFSGMTFGEFYNAQLKESKICMGLSRKLVPGGSQSYVITAPDSKLILEESDVAFILAE